MKLPNAKAPPGLGGALKTYSGLAATEYDSFKHNRETRKIQYRRSLVSNPRACCFMRMVYDSGPRAVPKMLNEASNHGDAMPLLAKYARVAKRARGHAR